MLSCLTHIKTNALTDCLSYNDITCHPAFYSAMEFIPDDCFNLIIDKALLDCVLCYPSNMTAVTKLVREMYRVLKPGGVYAVISHGPPETREGFLVGDEEAGLRWTISSTTLPKPPINDVQESDVDKSFYVYFCKKTAV
jgi:ubiquinone/menaquinone biosynthesis C-methylase UbiE